MQQTFLAAIQRRDQWDMTRPLFPWFAGILAHKVQHARRQENRRRGECLEGRSWVGRERTPLSAADASEAHGRVVEAVEALGEPYRELLVLHLVHGLPAHQIAHALGRSPGTVRMQLRRGKEQLKSVLPQEYHGALGALPGSALGLERLRASVIEQGSITAGVTAQGVTPPMALGLAVGLVVVALAMVAWVGAPSAAIPGGVELRGSLSKADPTTLVTLPDGASRPRRRDDHRDSQSRTHKRAAKGGGTSIRVLKQDGTPIAEAAVWREPLRTAERSSWSATWLGGTDAAGRLFTEFRLAHDGGRLWAVTPGDGRTGSVVVQRGCTGHAGSAREITLVLEDLPAPLWLRGRIVDSESYAPLADVRLAFEGDSNVAPTWTGPDGRFRLGPLARDETLERWTGPLLVARRAGLGVRAAPWRKLKSRMSDLGDAEAEWAPLYMDAAVPRRGRVVFQDGTPVPGAQVLLPSTGLDSGPLLSVRTNERGEFAVPLPANGASTALQASYPGFSMCSARVPTSKTQREHSPVELRFTETPGPRVLIHGLDDGIRGHEDVPLTVSIMREGHYFAAPMFNGSFYLPPADELPIHTWGKASVAIYGSEWFPIATVHQAIIKAKGVTELTASGLATGSLLVQSGEPPSHFAEGRTDALFLQAAPTEPRSSESGWAALPPFGVNLRAHTTLFQHVPVGTYHAEDSLRREAQVTVRAGQIAELVFQAQER